MIQKRIPTENFPLAIILPTAIVIPLTYFFFFINQPGTVLMMTLGPPFILGFLTVLIFGAFDVPYSRIIVVTSLSIGFYVTSAFGIMVLYGMLVFDAPFRGDVVLMFLSPYFIFWFFYTCVVAFAGAFAGGIVTTIFER